MLLVALFLVGGCASAPAGVGARRVTVTSGATESPRGAGTLAAKRGARRFRVGQRLRGRASYYSDRLAGRPTASGEPYDPHKMTAASRDLPLGTRLRVTRRDTGARVLVRVNDRGPFGDRRRILDLSRAAAERLGMIRRGVVPVTAEILSLPERAPKKRQRRVRRRGR